MNEYRRFLTLAAEDPDLVRELSAIEGDEKEIDARFSSVLTFGTAGLRGIIGAGSARMNVYTVSRATAGLYDVIAPNKKGEVPVFVVGYDTRIKSDLFARRTAEVLSSRGAKVYLAAEPIPVPFVSFATRKLSADAGICITASHNPAAYNGYKVFGADGSQLLEEDAAKVERAASEHDYFEPLPEAKGEITEIPGAVFDAYFAQLCTRFPSAKRSLKAVYTPLCGTGLRFVPRALSLVGFSDVALVKEQAIHDGHFPTCEKPNPEVRESLVLAEKLAAETGADLFLATDPDCDRVGVGVREKEGFRLLNGNETGLLLMDYLLRRAQREGTLRPDTFVCTTIVSAPMADALAADYGVTLSRVLTGFKYIGEQIGRLEKEGKTSDFLFGFEESYGCLASSCVRDKDACEACTLVCLMAEEYKREGKTLCDALSDLEARYGIYRSALKNYEFSTAADAARSAEILAKLRREPPMEIASFRVVSRMDCLAGVKTDETGGTTPLDLPKADVLSFAMENGTQLMVRPSGTEPKVKVYLFASDETETAAFEKLERLGEYADALFA